MNKEYFNVPSRNEAYEVTPDCCFVVVRYEENNEDIAIKRNDPANTLNTWDLQCHCDARMEIIPISYKQYREKYDYVMKVKEQRAA